MEIASASNIQNRATGWKEETRGSEELAGGLDGSAVLEAVDEGAAVLPPGAELGGLYSGGNGTRPLRIALISTPFLSVPPRDYGGTELVIYELAEGLVERGHEVVLFATGDSQSRAEVRSLYAKPQWPPNQFAELNHVSWAFRQIAQEGFDVVHAHCASALACARLVPDLPLLYTLHHPPTAELSEFYTQFPEVFHIAISARQKELEIPLSRCEVIHHGLDERRFECVERAKDFVCFVARYAEVKGPHLAIDAARLAGMRIQMAGEVHWPDRDFAARELERRMKEAHVEELGCVGIAKKVPLLRDARALLMPLQWEEPFGLIMIEAMLSGCPVIAFPHGSAPEIIEPGVTGLLVNSVEEMAEVIRAGGVLDEFDRRRCRSEAVARFGRERMVSEHIRVYEAAMEENRVVRELAAAV